MTTSIQEIIKNHILEEIFNEFPNNEGQHAFDFFLRSDVNCAEFVGESPLGTEWGFTVCEQYSYDNIRALRGLMQSQLDDLLRLQDTINQKCTLRISIFKSDMDDEDFQELKNKPTANINRSGTNDEYITFRTLRLGDVK